MQLFVLGLFVLGFDDGRHLFADASLKGYVPNSATAIAIAEAILTPVYGKKMVDAQKPFTAKLDNGMRIVLGTLPRDSKVRLPGGKILETVHFGGALEADITKTNGHVVNVQIDR